MKLCTECGRTIAGVVGDPVHVTTLGTFHGPCMTAAHNRAEQDERRRREETHERRSAAAKARAAQGFLFFRPGSAT